MNRLIARTSWLPFSIALSNIHYDIREHERHYVFVYLCCVAVAYQRIINDCVVALLIVGSALETFYIVL